MTTIDVPSDIGFKDQGLTPEELRAGQRAEDFHRLENRYDPEVPSNNNGQEHQGSGQVNGAVDPPTNTPIERVVGYGDSATLVVPAIPVFDAEGAALQGPNKPAPVSADYLSTYPAAPNSNPQGNKMSKKTLMIGLVAVACIAAGVGVGAFLAGGDDDSSGAVSTLERSGATSQPVISLPTTSPVRDSTPPIGMEDDSGSFVSLTPAPMQSPTTKPTQSPTDVPTGRPSLSLTGTPSQNPTPFPTLSPTGASGTWQQIGQDVDGEAAGDKFGIRVAISADGTTIAAGGDENSANGEESGHVRVFRFDSDLAEWRQVGQDLDGVAAGDRFGFSRLKLSGDGTVLAAGALNYDGFGSNAGLLRVFKYDSTANEWQQIGQDLNGENPGTNDFFGYPVGLSLDGTIVASGGVNRDSNGGGSGGVVVFEYSPFTNLWTPIGQEISGSQSSEFFGRTVAMSADGTIVAGSGYDNRDDPVLPELVRVHRYDVTSNSWVQMGQDLDGVPGDRFGAAISLSSGGQILAVGSSRYGDNNVGQVNVYQFDPVANRWQDLGQALNGEASNDGYGWTVSLSADGDILSTGASGHDSGGNGSGRVYVYEFDRKTNEWLPRGQFLDGEASFDGFGVSVALSADGNTLVSGALGNNGNGTDSGHVRVFKYIPP